MDQGNGFCLRWEKFTDFYRGSFSDLVKSENFTDMSLYCEGELVKCHRVILSASSTYFQNLLLQLNQVNPVIVMRDVELIDLKCVLSFIYTGEVTVLQDQLRRVVKLGEDLKVKGLGEEEERTPPSSDRVVDEPVCTVSEPKRRKLTARNTEKPPSRILTSPSSNITENSLTQHLSRNVDHFGTIDQFGTAADTKAVTESAISVKSEIFFADDVNTNESLRKGASECEETLPDLEQSVLDAKIFRTLEQTNEHSGEGSSDAGVTTGFSETTPVAHLPDEPPEVDVFLNVSRKQCVLCGKLFEQLEKGYDHYMVHHKESVKMRQLKCELCGFVTKTYNSLWGHRSVKHRGIGRTRLGRRSFQK